MTSEHPVQANVMWQPTCHAVLFGLIATTVLAFVIVPCWFALFTRAPALTNQN